MADPILTAAAVAVAVEKASETWKKVSGYVKKFLGASEPSPEELILDALEILFQKFDAMQEQLDLVFEAVKELVELEQQIYVLELRRDLDQLRGQSRTAVDQVRAWIDGGRTDIELRANADNNSRIPANTLLEGNSFFERPDAEMQGTVFDHRLAIIAYMYALTVRFGVIAALNPQYRNNAITRDELARHVERLDWVIAQADSAIDPHVGGRLDTEQGLFYYYQQGNDRISGFEEEHYQSNWNPGGQAELDYALATSSQMARASVQDHTGLSGVMELRYNLAFEASDPRIPRWSSWTLVPYDDLGDGWALRAASTTPGGVSLFWHETSQERVRAVSYVPGADAGWRPPVDVVAAGGAQRYEDSPFVAVSQAPGKATVLFTAGRRDHLPTATHTDPSSPTGWLQEPVQLAETYFTFNATVVPDRDRVAIFWEDGTEAVSTMSRQGEGAWSPVTTVTPPGSGGLALTAVSPGPGGVWVFWRVEDGSIHATCYDPRQPQPAWAAPFPVIASGPRLAGITAFSPRPWAIHLFWVGDDDEIWGTHLDDVQPSATWAEPYIIAPPVSVRGGSFLEASATRDGRINVFWAGHNRSTWTTYYDPGTASWAPPFDIGRPRAALPLLTFATASATADTTSVFLTDTDAEGKLIIKAATLDMTTGTPAARMKEASALIAQANRLWTLPSPARDEAVARALDAVEVAREAAAADQTYAVTLAEWLAAPVSAYLAAVGRHDEAVAAGEESVGIFRERSEAKPDDAERQYKLAWALVTLAQRYWNKPDRPEGVSRAVEAADLLRPLAERDAKYRSTLAYWLTFPVTPYLAGVGRYDEAIAAGEESVAIYRELSEAKPDDAERRYKLAWALVTFAQTYWNKPDKPQGLARALEATDLVRALSRQEAKYEPALGDWLIFPVSPYLAGSGRREEAIALAQEAVDIFTRLSAADPDRHGPQLTRAKAWLAELQN
jgi:hypothetical protein